MQEFYRKCESKKRWELVPLTEVVYINREMLKDNTEPSYEIQYIDIESVTTGNISTPKKMLFSDAPSRARRVVQSGDLLLSMVRPYLKAFAVVNNHDTNLIASTGFAVLTPKVSGLSDYLFAFSISSVFYRQIQDKMVGTAYPAITANDLNEVFFFFLKDSKEIGAITTILNDIIAMTQQAKDVLDGILLIKKIKMKELLNIGGDYHE